MHSLRKLIWSGDRQILIKRDEGRPKSRTPAEVGPPLKRRAINIERSWRYTVRSTRLGSRRKREEERDRHASGRGRSGAVRCYSCDRGMLIVRNDIPARIIASRIQSEAAENACLDRILSPRPFACASEIRHRGRLHARLGGYLTYTARNPKLVGIHMNHDARPPISITYAYAYPSDHACSRVGTMEMRSR